MYLESHTSRHNNITSIIHNIKYKEAYVNETIYRYIIFIRPGVI